jgi:hypothetical protein
MHKNRLGWLGGYFNAIMRVGGHFEEYVAGLLDQSKFNQLYYINKKFIN